MIYIGAALVLSRHGVAREYVDNAKSSINRIPGNEYKDSLYSLADFVVERVN